MYIYAVNEKTYKKREEPSKKQGQFGMEKIDTM